jgi:hypothetical protein
MNKTNFLGHEIIFGTYFIGQWIDKSGANDIQEALQGLQKNPFKNIPLFIKIGIEETAFLNGKETEISLFDLSNEIDAVGGVQGKDVQDLLNFFIASISVKNDDVSVEKKTQTVKKK